MTNDSLNPQTLTAPAQEPDPEVLPRATRRQFSASEKLAILDELASLQGTGQIGSYMRQNGLYSSQVSAWRQAFEEGGAQALEPRTRGPKPLPQEELAKRALEEELARLQKKNQALERRLAQAEAIIDVQKKVSALLNLLPQES